MNDLLMSSSYRASTWRIYEHVREELDRGEPEAAWERWRQERRLLWQTHPYSPVPEELRSTWAGQPLWEYDSRYAWTFDLEATAPLEGSQDSAATQPVQGSRAAWGQMHLVTTLDTPFGELQLAWHQGYGGGFFLGLRDATNGHSTYGGGRYVLDGPKGAYLGTDNEGRLRVDLNFAYQPTCARSPRWNCPMPLGPRWEHAVEAGEQLEDPVWLSPHSSS